MDDERGGASACLSPASSTHLLPPESCLLRLLFLLRKNTHPEHVRSLHGLGRQRRGRHDQSGQQAAWETAAQEAFGWQNLG
jgi:hypothetical protein